MNYVMHLNPVSDVILVILIIIIIKIIILATSLIDLCLCRVDMGLVYSLSQK